MHLLEKFSVGFPERCRWTHHLPVDSGYDSSVRYHLLLYFVASGRNDVKQLGEPTGIPSWLE